MLGRLNYTLVQWFWAGMDLLYLPHCGGCNTQGVRWCEDCQKRVLIISPQICELCGQPQHNQGLCSRCKKSPPPYSALISWATFSGPVRQVLLRLKYHHDLGLGEVLSRSLIYYLQGLEWEIDMIVSIPLGVARLKRRGYNQADLIARPLASGSGYLYNKTAVIRERETLSQVGLTVSQRKSNMDGAFRADPLRVANRSILIVDDVSTSGATIEACTAAVLQAGARKVYGLTLAKTVQTNNTFSDKDSYPIRYSLKSYQEES